MKTNRLLATIALLIALLALSVLPAGAGTPTPAPAPAATPVDLNWGRMPLYFTPNRGQMDERVAYYLQGSDKTLYFTAEGVTLALHDADGQRYVLRLDFVGANPNVRPEGREPTEAVLSYFQGRPDEWRAGLPTYAAVAYRDLWPGIDLVYRGTASRLKYEFLVHPGADPAQIRLAYRGATDVSLDAAGQLQVNTPVGGFYDARPYAYQQADGRRTRVAVDYALAAAPAGAHGYGFRLGSYDPRRPLVIDPAMLIYAGYIGGFYGDVGHGIAVDGTGNAYVTGYTVSYDTDTFPVLVGPDLTFNGGGYDAFVAKVKADGTGLVYAGFIGGAADDRGYGIAVDADGRAYVTGTTLSDEASFPVATGPDLTFNGTRDSFVARVKADGTGLDYCGYIGGANDDEGEDIAVDATGHAYIVGTTMSENDTFPIAVGPDLTYGGATDAFVAKVSANGSGLDYCGYVGAMFTQNGTGVAVDRAGSAYVAGITHGQFAVLVGPDLTYNGAWDAFVAKILPDGTDYVYAGYIGGAEDDYAWDIAVDRSGRAHVIGETESAEDSFPTRLGPDLIYNGGDSDAFVARVKADGSALVYSGYIGGSDRDEGQAIAVNLAGNAYVAGTTFSDEATFPTVGGPDSTFNGSYDAFLAQVRGDGRLETCGYIGGSSGDWGYGLALDAANNVYITGETACVATGFPARVGPSLTCNGSQTDVFVAKVGTTAWGSPSSWHQANVDGFGDSDNRAVWAGMAVLGNHLYVGTENSAGGAEVWRTDTGMDWSRVATAGFDDAHNDDVSSMAVLDGYLYAGTYNHDSGGEVWRTADGTAWTQVHLDGFGDSHNTDIQALALFSDTLYAGTHNSATGGELWRSTDGLAWTQVYIDGLGDANNVAIPAIATFGGELYLATDNAVTGTELWRSPNGDDWAQVNAEGFGSADNAAVWTQALVPFDGYLYAGTHNNVTGAEVWRSADGVEWDLVNEYGFGDAGNTIAASMMAWLGHLYVGTYNPTTGAELWRTPDGASWQQVNADGFGDTHNQYIWSMAVFQDRLYASTGNDDTGAEVWRTGFATYLPLVVRH